MKRDPYTAMLVVVFAIVTMGSVVLCYQYLKDSRKLRYLQEQTARVNQRKSLMQSLALEMNEYARRNPAMNPVLERLNMRMRAATNAPATTP